MVIVAGEFEKKCLLLSLSKSCKSRSYLNMKKFKLLIILFALALTVKAQEGLSVSPFVGVAGSGIIIKNDVVNIQGYSGMNAGFEGGIKVQYEFSTPITFEIQTFYNRCGYSMIIPHTGMNKEIDFYMDFLSVPFYVGYNIYVGEKENFIISPKVGISPNIFLNTYAQFNDREIDTNVDNVIDWRASLELEFTYKINNLLSLFFDVNARAGWGIITYTNISDIVSEWREPGIYNYVVSGNLGLKFKLTNREKEIYEFY